jgi:hypothetical protein
MEGARQFPKGAIDWKRVLSVYQDHCAIHCSWKRKNSGTPHISGHQTVSPHQGILFCLRYRGISLSVTVGLVKPFLRPGFAFGAGGYRILGFGFAIAFVIPITAGQIFAYSHAICPAIDYETSRRARLTMSLGHSASDPLRLCSAIASVLPGTIRCTPNLGGRFPLHSSSSVRGPANRN